MRPDARSAHRRVAGTRRAGAPARMIVPGRSASTRAARAGSPRTRDERGRAGEGSTSRCVRSESRREQPVERCAHCEDQCVDSVHQIGHPVTHCHDWPARVSVCARRCDTWMCRCGNSGHAIDAPAGQIEPIARRCEPSAGTELSNDLRESPERPAETSNRPAECSDRAAESDEWPASTAQLEAEPSRGGGSSGVECAPRPPRPRTSRAAFTTTNTLVTGGAPAVIRDFGRATIYRMLPAAPSESQDSASLKPPAAQPRRPLNQNPGGRLLARRRHVTRAGGTVAAAARRFTSAVHARRQWVGLTLGHNLSAPEPSSRARATAMAIGSNLAA